MQKRYEESLFLAKVIGELQALLLGTIRSCCNIRFISVDAASLFTSGNLRGDCFRGGLFAVLMRCSIKLQRPISPFYFEKASTFLVSKRLSDSASTSDNIVFDDLNSS